MRFITSAAATVLFTLLHASPAFGAANGAGGESRELAKAKSHYILVKPKGFDAAKTYDLVIALHGMGDTAENYTRIFWQFMNGRECLLAVPEGSEKVGPGYAWNTDDLNKVVEMMEDVSKVAKFDAKRVLLAGHSAGSLVGWYMVVKRPDLFAFYGQTAQGVAPAVNWLFKEAELAKIADKIPVYFGLGTKDPNQPNFEPSKKLLEKLKFNFKCEAPEIGHTITPDEVKNMFAHFDATVKKDVAQKK
jgi:predicted esterase